MSDERFTISCLAVIMIGMCSWMVVLDLEISAHEKRITALEQSQAVAKESQKAADYKYDLCRKQLGHRD